MRKKVGQEKKFRDFHHDELEFKMSDKIRNFVEQKKNAKL